MKLKVHTSIEETTISSNAAAQRTGRWRQKFREAFGEETEMFRGFRIPAQDIIELAEKLQETNHPYVRAYLAIESEAAPELSLVLVQVRADETDVLTHGEVGHERSAIYDFTQPCPPCCDVNSILHKGLDAEH